MVSFGKEFEIDYQIFIEYWIETALMSIGAIFFAFRATAAIELLSGK
jgi:hypothetical protein